MGVDDNALARALSARPGAAARRYEVRRELGGGGMALVFEVYEPATERSYALKRLRPLRDDAHARRAAELLAREFHTLAQLQHPRIVAVSDFGLDDQGPFYTMELLDGGDLEALAPCAPVQACAIARDICSGLSFLHSRRLLHRDVSAANVRCSADGRAKLIDFGTVAPMGMGPNKLLIGTPVYCPPEALYMQPLDARADLFALGATLYYLLTGRYAYPAWDFPSLPEAWQHHPPPPSQLVSGIPGGLDALVLELLSPERELRPSSASEVMERLGAIEGRNVTEHSAVAQAYLTTPAFVGRELELARVRRQAARASRGCGSSLLVRGPSGVGLSRFLDAGILAAKISGFLVLRADAGDASVGDYGVARRLLWQLLRLRPGLASRLDPAERESLASLLPPMAAGCRLPIEPMTGSVASRAIELGQALILRAAQDGALLIAVDDLDTVDEPSLSLLARLAHAAAQERLLILSAAVVDVPPRAPQPFGLLARGSSEAKLLRFSAAESEHLIGSLFGIEGRPAQLQLLAGRLHALSDGCPRKLMRLAQHLVDSGLASYKLGAWTLAPEVIWAELPARAADWLTARLGACRQEARDLAYALSLCPELSFSFDECRQLSGHSSPAELVADLAQLSHEELVRADEVLYGLTDRAFGQVLLAGLDPQRQALLQLRLADVFAARPHSVVWRGRALLRAGATEQAIDVLLEGFDALARSELGDAAVVARAVRNLPADWAEVFSQAIQACQRLGRARMDEYRLRLGWARMLAVVGHAADEPLPRLIRLAVEASPLPEWQQLEPGLPAAQRFALALERARARYDQTPANVRLMDPRSAIGALTECIRYTVGVAAPAFDVQAVRSLPSLEPFYPAAPGLRIVEQLKRGVYARITGRWDETRQLYHGLLCELDQARSMGLDAIGAQYASLFVSSALIALEASLGVACAQEQLARLEAQPVFAVNALSIRALMQLWSGDVTGAERGFQAADLRRLSNSVQQSFEQVALVWQLQAYAAFEDAPRLKRTLLETAQVAERCPGWLPFVAYGRAELLRLRGRFTEALTLVQQALSRLLPGDHHAWALLAACQVRALDAAGSSAQAIHQGFTHLEGAEPLGPSACQPILLALSLTLARAGDARAEHLAERALMHVARSQVAGANRALAHEARAWVALLRRDTACYEQQVAQLMAAVETAADSAFGHKLQRLQQHARQLGP